MSRRLAIAALALAATLAGCDVPEVTASRQQGAVVTANRGAARRFWATFRTDDGTVFEKVRVGGKRCRRGPTRLAVGTRLSIAVEELRYDDGRTARRLDRSGMRSRYC